jgi:hypothetical protein
MTQQEPWTYEHLITAPKTELVDEANSKLKGGMGANPNAPQAAIHARDAIQAQLFLSELSRRNQEVQTDKMARCTQTMLRYTWIIVFMTGIMTVATIVQVFIACILLRR